MDPEAFLDYIFDDIIARAVHRVLSSGAIMSDSDLSLQDTVMPPYRPRDTSMPIECFMNDERSKEAVRAIADARENDPFFNANMTGRLREAEKSTRDHPAGTPTVVTDYDTRICFAYNIDCTIEEERERRQRLRQHRRDFEERMRKIEEKEEKAWENRRRGRSWDGKKLPSYWRVRQSWFSDRLQAWVHIYEHSETLKCRAEVSRNRAFSAARSKTPMLINTMKVATEAWTIEAEEKAMQLLKQLITERQYKSYFLTGAFPELSRRTQRLYVFRRIRPALMFRRVYPDKQEFRYIAALCVHPMGYYSMTWAGVMCPTDEVIAHLLWMRSDELAYLKSANFHDERSSTGDF